MTGPVVSITAAKVDTPDGVLAALISLVEIGGGSQVVTVDGIPEERIHPRSQAFHVRLVSPDRMLPDDLRDAPTFDDAVQIGVKYAIRLSEHAERLAELADDLAV